MSTDTLYNRMFLALAGSSGPYLEKDLQKAVGATKFIGRGSALSSTNRYRLAAGDLANCGQYQQSDVVFISAEGARRGRIPIDRDELGRAVAAGATIVADTPYDRARPYNVGEREVVEFLSANGYADYNTGRWTPQNQTLFI